MYWVENVLIQQWRKACQLCAGQDGAMYQYRQICPPSNLILRSTGTRVKNHKDMKTYKHEALITYTKKIEPPSQETDYQKGALSDHLAPISPTMT